MSEGTYQGWKNYPTWAVALWINNDQGFYLGAREVYRDHVARDDGWGDYSFGDALKEWLKDITETSSEGLTGDLLTYAWEEVEWVEIATALRKGWEG